MKVLVIEDRDSLLNVLDDVLGKSGLVHMSAETVDEGLSAIKISKERLLVILDTSVSNGNGLSLVSEIEAWQAEPESKKERRERAERGPFIIVMRGVREAVPKSSAFIKAELTKPFTTRQLLDAIAATVPKGEMPAPAEGGTEALNPNDELVRCGITYGESYVFFQDSPGDILHIMQTFSKGGYDMFIITTSRAKVARDRFGLDVGADVFTLRGSTYPLGTLLGTVRGFLAKSRLPVIAMEDLDSVIERCGTNRTFLLLNEILSMRKEHAFTFLTSADGNILSSLQKEMLTGMMTLYKEK